MFISALFAARMRQLRVGLASLLVLAVILVPALKARAQEPSLATLAVAVWPEYDQPEVLVILEGTIQEGVALPQSLAVALPSEAEVNAVAYRDASGILRSLPWEVSAVGDGQAVTFEAPERDFVVEYYADVISPPPERAFELAMALPYASEQTQLIVRQPSRASDFAVVPEMDPAGLDDLGNPLYTLTLGPTTAGQVVPLQMTYTKQDAIPSLEGATEQAPVGPGLQAEEVEGGIPDWLLVVLGVAAGAGVVALVLWAVNRYRLAQASLTRQQRRWKARQSGREGTPRPEYCTQCGQKYAAGDQFCRHCGSRRA